MHDPKAYRYPIAAVAVLVAVAALLVATRAATADDPVLTPADTVPLLRVDKTVDTGDQDPVPLGGVVTYTVVITNGGTGVAMGAMMTDTLLAGVTFGAWAEQGGGTVNVPLQIVTWGPQDVAPGEFRVVSFTADVTDDPSYRGYTVSNVAFVSAANAPLDADSANFVIEADYHVYLPAVACND